MLMSSMEHSARLEALVRQMDGAVLFESGEGEVLLVNQRLCDIFGLPGTPTSLLGQPAEPVHNSLARQMQDPTEFHRSTRACRASQVPVSGARMACRTGRIVERDFAPVWSEGRCLGNLWVYRDVTRQVRILERLKESEARLAGLLSATADPMWSLDHDLRLQAFNDNFVRLCDANWSWIPVPGDALESLPDPEERKRQCALYRRALGGETLHAEWSPPGQPHKAYEVRISPIVVPGRGTVGVAGHLHDITSRRRARVLIDRARVSAEDDAEAKSRFLARVSHEIRTPLDAVLGLTEIALEEARHPRVQGLLESVKQNATALRSLVEDTLSFNRQGPSSHQSWADEVLRQEAREPAPPPTIRPAIRRKPPPPTPAALQRTARILVVEDTDDSAVVVIAALEAAGHEAQRAPDGETAVTMAAERGWDLVLMDIDLPGISGLQATERIRAGEAAEGHDPVPILALTAHATPDARRAADEVGMQAFLVKPIARPNLYEAVQLHADLRPHIWVVDDDADSRRLLEHYLGRDGCIVDSFESGWDALRALQDGEPDLILLDVELPDMRGPDVAAALRAAKVTCPILALSAHSDAGPQQEALDAGCDRWLDKPIQGSDLRAAIGDALAAQAVDEAQLDDDIADLRPLFLEDRHRDLERLDSTLAQGNWAVAQRIGHSIKGTSAPYGFPVLGHIGARLEVAARNQDASVVREQVEAMRRFLQQHE